MTDLKNLEYHRNNSQNPGLKPYQDSPKSPPLTLIDLKQRAESGRASDIDYLMEHLAEVRTLTEHKLIDYALGLVSSAEGRERIRYFLFNGSQIQRNYAALYFKRREATQLLDEAVRRGCIDLTQAYLK